MFFRLVTTVQSLLFELLPHVLCRLYILYQCRLLQMAVSDTAFLSRPLRLTYSYVAVSDLARCPSCVELAAMSA
jgi:hypothetical protein